VTRVLHLLRDRARQPGIPVAASDRIVVLGEVQADELVTLAFEYDLVLVW